MTRDEDQTNLDGDIDLATGDADGVVGGAPPVYKPETGVDAAGVDVTAPLRDGSQERGDKIKGVLGIQPGPRE